MTDWIKRTLSAALCLAMVLSLAACGGVDTPAVTSDEPSADASAEPSAESGILTGDEDIYMAAMGDFYDAYMAAFETGSLSERWAQMAIAEAKFLESGVATPMYTAGGCYAMSRMPFRAGGYASWLGDRVYYDQMVLTNEIITTEDYEHLVDMWYELTGTGTYTFSPSAPTSRAMLVTILWRLQGEPYVSGSSFSDVKSSAYYYDAVRWAARYGIVEGYEGNVFKPDDAITREQFAAILYRYAEYCKYSTSASTNLSAYKDNAKVSSWAGTAMKWAVAKGLFEGDNLGNLDPQGQTTRAAAAKLLMAFCENVAS